MQFSIPPATVPARCDVVVIGGGVMGISSAYWLTRAGVDVLLVEARRLGWGATGRNAGLLLGGSGPLEDLRLVRDILREESIDAGYAEPGHLALASSSVVWDKIRHEVVSRPATLTPLFALDPVACEELLGMRINPRFLGGRWLPSGAMLHPGRFICGLAAAAWRRGLALATGTEALRVESSGYGLRVRTTRGSITARQVVYACNTRVAHFVPDYKPLIAPVRGQVLSTQQLPPLFSPGMAVDWGSVYWRQAADGSVVLGGYRDKDVAAESAAEERVNPRIQNALDRFLPEAFPGFPPFRVRQRWAGIMDCTTDGKPMVGALPNAPNQWVICGFGGHGLPAALGAGKALAMAATTGKIPPILDPLDPGRFHRDTVPC